MLICYSCNHSLILLLPQERLLKFAMSDSLLIKHGFRKCLSVTPTKRSEKMHWLHDHKNHTHQLIYAHFNTHIMGDSIAAGLSCYSNVWETFFNKSWHCWWMHLAYSLAGGAFTCSKPLKKHRHLLRYQQY